MVKTIVALFNHTSDIRPIIESLMKTDFVRGSMNIMTNDVHNRYGFYLNDEGGPNSSRVRDSEGGDLDPLASLLAITVPGLGVLLVSGSFATSLIEATLSTVPISIARVLDKGGVSEDKVWSYAKEIRQGGTLISLQTSNTGQAKDVMKQYGAINIHKGLQLRGYRSQKRFTAKMNEQSLIARSEEKRQTELTPDKRSTQVAPAVRKTQPLAIEFLIDEPEIDDDDTAKTKALWETDNNLEVHLVNPAIASSRRGDPYPRFLLVEHEIETDDDLRE